MSAKWPRGYRKLGTTKKLLRMPLVLAALLLVVACGGLDPTLKLTVGFNGQRMNALQDAVESYARECDFSF
jgi:hypothetical protein